MKEKILNAQHLNKRNSTEEAKSPAITSLRCYLRSCCISGVKQWQDCIAFLRFLSNVDASALS